MAYDQSIADVIKSTVQDANELLRSEIALAKTELREEMRRAGAAAGALAGAAAAALIAVVFILTAVALGLAVAFEWPAWAGFAIIGVILAIAALALAAMGRSRLKGERHMPMTVDTLKENMQWIRTQQL